MALFIDRRSKEYPLKHDYEIKGPNSNTYTQWVLDQFPRVKLKLPINAFGKDYKIA